MSMNFGKLNFSTSFKPTAAFPLNANCYFESLEQAIAAAATAEEVGSSNTVYHYGQEIAVVENNKATIYVIQPDKTLKEVGATPAGDGTSVEVVDGKIRIIGFAGAESGSQPRKKADGTIEWVKPDTSTVEGLQTLVSGLESDVETLQTSKANAADVYTKNEVDTKLSAVYRYSGSVNSYADLPTDLTNTDSDIGKTYNVKTANKAHGIKAGDNVAWTGTEWDVLAGEVDLSTYSTTEQITAELDKKVDKVDGSRLITAEEAAKIATAEANVIESVDTAQFALDGDKKLTLLDVAMSKVTGLTDALADKVDKVEGSRLITEAEATKLGAIESGAQANILEVVKLNGEALAISEKGVDIPVAGESLGVVKSSAAENKVSVGTDGEMSVNNVNVNKLVQTDGETLILNGGTSEN